MEFTKSCPDDVYYSWVCPNANENTEHSLVNLLAPLDNKHNVWHTNSKLLLQDYTHALM